MKKLLSLGVLSLLVGTTLVCAIAAHTGDQQSRGKNETVQKRFVGAWRLAWLEEPGPDGKIHRAGCTGLLVFTRDGHMSVQVMYPNVPDNPQAASTAGVQYARGGYEASFGTYAIDEGGHTFTYHVEGALVRSLIGKDLPRSFELSGKRLIVNSTSPDEHWRVAWEHD